MENKTIRVDQEAYALLKSHKKRDESFSDLVKRHFRPPRKLSEFAGAWSDLSSKEWTGFERDRKLGKEADRRRAERVRRTGEF
jgi:predicted CopG family antitoxin